MFFIIAGFLPLILSEFVVFRIYEQNLMELALSNVEQMFSYISANTKNVSSTYYDIANKLYTFDSDNNFNLLKILKKSTQSPLLPEETKVKQQMEEEIVNWVLGQSPYIKGAVFVEYDYTMTASTRIDGILKPNYDCSYIPYILDIFEKKQDFTFLSTHKAEYYNDDTQVITFAKALMNNINDGNSEGSGDTQVLGVLLVDVYVGAIGNYFENIDRELMNVFYLVDGDGNCIYSIDNAWIGRKIYEYTNHINNPYLKDSKGRGKYFYSELIPVVNWTLICGVDENYFSSKVYTIRNLTVAVSILGMALCLVFALFGSKALTKPINHIVEKMKCVQEGDLNLRVDLNGQDELGHIGESFNIMVKELKETIQKMYVMQLKQKEVELNALKSQIQPHFLYNTLEVIRMVADQNGDENIADMIHSLSSQFRYLIHSGNDVVTVRKEITIIEEYFKLIEVRYAGRVLLEILLHESTKDMEIPKLTLQPIVENSIAHALKAKGGKVQIVDETRDNMRIIEVKDNGIGMTKERADEVRAAISGGNVLVSENGISTGMGLKNVNERLKMFYGEKYTMTISSLEGVGTSVRICIPLEGSGNSND